MRLSTLPKIFAWTLVLLVGSAATRVMAIAVAPTAVYVSDGRPATAVTLYNPSSTPEEVEVDILFGYPTTDEEGRVFLHVDSAGEDPRSAVEWIRVLPRRLVVPPEERRVVRLLARPPAGTPDGEYWARLAFTSRGQQIPVDGAPDSAGVQVGLSLEVRTIISLSYRKGEVTTGIEVEEFQPDIRGDSLVVWPELVRQGAGAYIGRIVYSLLDPEGREVRAWEEQVAVYRDFRRRYSYPVGDLASGTYRLVMRLSTDREDIPEADRLVTLPVEVTAEVRRP